MRLFLVLLLSTVAVDARVTFAKSEVLDNVDLKGANAVASFRCPNGCTVYSPTQNDKITVVDAANNTIMTLRMISSDNKGFELPGGKYSLKNTGPADPSFVFYAVERGAANYGVSTVFYQNSADPFILDASLAWPVTILSSTGAVSFSNFSGFQEDNLPTVFATGFDSISSCRPVYNPKSLVTLAHTTFPVNSPIATIKIRKNGAGQWVSVGGDYSSQTSMAKDSSAVYVSPGYVGCPYLYTSVGDSLYTLLPPVYTFDQSVHIEDANELTVLINADYSIDYSTPAGTVYAIQLTVNSDVEKYYGKNSLSEQYIARKFDISLFWTRAKVSKDAFTMQIDISAKSPGARATARSASRHFAPCSAGNKNC